METNGQRVDITPLSKEDFVVHLKDGLLNIQPWQKHVLEHLLTLSPEDLQSIINATSAAMLSHRRMSKSIISNQLSQFRGSTHGMVWLNECSVKKIN